MNDMMYKTTLTHEDFQWPRLVPLLEKPTQPPLRTGVRLFCPKLDTRICKEETRDYDGFVAKRDKVEKMKEEEDGVLMSRRRAMLMNEHEVNEYHVCDIPRSSYQMDFYIDEFSYDDLINEAFGMKVAKRKRRRRGTLVDPLSFKKTIDKETVFD